MLVCRFIGTTGTFVDEHPTNLQELARKLSCQKRENVKDSKYRLKLLLKDVSTIAADDLAMLDSASEVVVGMRIVQQFVIDLLGRNTPIATIFKTKTEAE